MRLFSAALLSLVLTGCVGLGGRVSSVTYPDGKVYKVRCQSDGKVHFKAGEVEILVDNRGPAGQAFAAGMAAVGKSADVIKEVTK